jgi:hypothetical protein
MAAPRTSAVLGLDATVGAPDATRTYSLPEVVAEIIRYDDAAGQIPCETRFQLGVSLGQYTAAELRRFAAWILERAEELDAANTKTAPSLAS